MYLLDTNIVSADAPAKRQVGLEAFSAWLRRHGDDLYISTVTIAEIEAGMARAVRIGAGAKAEQLRQWIAAVEHIYAGRILAFGIEEARTAGAILDRARARDPGFETSPSPRRPPSAASRFSRPTSATSRRSACLVSTH